MERMARTRFGVGRFVVAASLAAVLCIASESKAALTFGAVGRPIDAQSWLQPFEIQSTSAFSNVALVLTPLDATSGFKVPAWDFSTSAGNPAGFTGGDIYSGFFGSQFTVASGAPTTDLAWVSHFQGNQWKQTFILTLFAWDGAFNWEVATGLWDGAVGAWDFGPRTGGITWNEFKDMGGVAGGVPTVPVPSAVLLGVFGLSMVAGSKRRQRNK